jgi:hypothetical protein
MHQKQFFDLGARLVPGRERTVGQLIENPVSREDKPRERIKMSPIRTVQLFQQFPLWRGKSAFYVSTGHRTGFYGVFGVLALGPAEEAR